MVMSGVEITVCLFFRMEISRVTLRPRETEENKLKFASQHFKNRELGGSEPVYPTG